MIAKQRQLNTCITGIERNMSATVLVAPSPRYPRDSRAQFSEGAQLKLCVRHRTDSDRPLNEDLLLSLKRLVYIMPGLSDYRTQHPPRPCVGSGQDRRRPMQFFQAHDELGVVEYDNPKTTFILTASKCNLR